MRDPDSRPPPAPSRRVGRNFDEDSQFRYLAPGAFTVLPPENDPPPDPPVAPASHRLTPVAKRHKNQAFSIIAEPSSQSGSRSPSPTGRVSPFRGRGFNPAGSRHASPAPSPPPPEDPRRQPKQSKIPRITPRGGGGSVFGEKVAHYDISPNRRKINQQLSQSLTNLSSDEARRSSKRPPHGLKKNGVYSKAPAFQQLSPILGSSPEPSQSQSSPSRIPKSRSTPPSRITSPSRSKTQKRPDWKIVSSRDTSPCKAVSPPRATPRSYRNVQAKVNSFNKTKPKVPPKPIVTSDSEMSDRPINNKSRISRRDSLSNNKRVNSSKLSKVTNNSSDSTATARNVNNAKSDSTRSLNKIGKQDSTNCKPEGKLPLKKKDSSINVSNSEMNFNKAGSTSKSNSTAKNNDASGAKETNTMSSTSNAASAKGSNNNSRNSSDQKTDKPMKISEPLQPSTTAVVSSTTTTATQPLKIEAKVDVPSKADHPAGVSPIVDGRVLSATSVTQAINKMNDTVLDTQTLIKDHVNTKLSPAANAIISMSNNETKGKITSKTDVTTKTDSNVVKTSEAARPAEGTMGTISAKTDKITANSNNHTSSIGIMDSKALEREIQNNMSKLISPDHKINNLGTSIQKTANDRLIEARTVVAADVKPAKPIQITVREKPTEVEVQSGNVRFPMGSSNGLMERPSLSPNAQSNESAPDNPDPQKGNRCSRFWSNARSKLQCNRCKRKSKTKENTEKLKDKEEDKVGCFSCRRCRRQKSNSVRINIEDEAAKSNFWQRLNCCKRNGKVSDTKGWFTSEKRAESWGERRDSILSTPQLKPSRCSKQGCRNFLAAMFCLNLCRKKEQKKFESDLASRRASTLSKKKSLTPTVPVEDNKPKLDMSLVEHTSQMKAAIPVLPICLAWFCLVMNCVLPGTGTIFSGLFCLCIGIPRFSQKDGARQRIGSFIINFIIGIGQCFTVLFCLVGWGWSIWWGLIMVKLARKYKKIKMLEANAAQDVGQRPVNVRPGQRSRDPERGK